MCLSSRHLFDLIVTNSTVLVFGGAVPAIKGAMPEHECGCMAGTRKSSLEGSRAVGWCPSPKGFRQGPLFVFARMALDDIIPCGFRTSTFTPLKGPRILTDMVRWRWSWPKVTALKIGNIEFGENPAKHELDAFDETNCTHSTDLGGYVTILGPSAGIRQGHSQMITPKLQL